MKNTYSHIYLYAKCWYKRTNALEDLKIILAARTAIEPRFIRKQDVLREVAYCAFESINASGNPSHFFTKLIMEIDRGRDSIEGMLSILSLRTLSKDFQLDDTDYTILPRREGA